MNGNVHNIKQVIEFICVVLKALGKILEKLSPDVLQGYIGNSNAVEKGLRFLISPQSANDLLAQEGEVAVNCGDKKFIPRDRIKKGSEELPISRYDCGSNFITWMMPKTEDPVGEQILVVNRLMKYSSGTDIVEELGGEGKAGITLQEFYHFLKSADQTKWYIAFICDAFGVLRAVYAYWLGDGWSFDANPLGRDWDDDDRVVSRKPCGAQS